MTNREKINNMTDEELAFILMCPYDTLGKSFDEMPCHADGCPIEQVTAQKCMECAIAWLRAQAEDCEVERLDENEWVPCSERLPEQSGQYIVTLAGADEVKICEYYAGVKAWDILRQGIEDGEAREVLAWKPKPKIWQPS